MLQSDLVFCETYNLSKVKQTPLEFKGNFSLWHKDSLDLQRRASHNGAYHKHCQNEDLQLDLKHFAASHADEDTVLN